MRITQLHCTLPHFREEAEAKFNIPHVPHPDQDKPLLYIGCYVPNDYNVVHTHRSTVVVFWCGSDSERLAKFGYNSVYAHIFRHTIYSRNIHHIAISHWIAEDLKSLDIPNIYEYPILLKKESDITPEPLGDCVYMYNPGSHTYNGGMYEEIKAVLPYGFIETNSKTFDRETLLKAYKNCFVGLRFSKHDGLAHTACELGLMGRPIIHNGDMPNCIKYKDGDVEDVISKIKFMYEVRDKYPFRMMAGQVADFLNIDFDLLDLKNYK